MRKYLARTVLLDYIRLPWKYNNGKYDLVTWAMKIVGGEEYIELITINNKRRRGDDIASIMGEPHRV